MSWCLLLDQKEPWFPPYSIEDNTSCVECRWIRFIQADGYAESDPQLFCGSVYIGYLWTKARALDKEQLAWVTRSRQRILDQVQTTGPLKLTSWSIVYDYIIQQVQLLWLTILYTQWRDKGNPLSEQISYNYNIIMKNTNNSNNQEEW